MTKESDLFVDNILKKFGANSGVIVPNIDNIVIEKFPTGSLKLDRALKGGYPVGKIVEVFGDTGTGKTTLCLEAVAQFQSKYPDGHTLWIDLEDVFDPEYNANIGVDVHHNFILSKPTTGEQAWDIIVSFVKQFKNSIIILDSVSVLLPEAEDNGDMSDASFALAARMNNKGLRKIMPHIAKNKITVFVVNQLREKVGVMFGNPNTTTGGNGWKFYARTRIECSSSKGDLTVSSNHKYKLLKTNYGIKDSVVETSIKYGFGFDTLNEILDVAVEAGVIKRSGSWYSYEDTKLGQGASAVTDLLADNPELMDEILAKL